MNAIADFLLRFRSLIDAHVVNVLSFLQGRLWETIDSQWMECRRKEPVENYWVYHQRWFRKLPSSSIGFFLPKSTSSSADMIAYAAAAISAPNSRSAESLSSPLWSKNCRWNQDIAFLLSAHMREAVMIISCN